MGLLDEPLLPLDPGLHLPRRQRIDVRRLPHLPPLGFDLLELLHNGGLLAAELHGLLPHGKLLGLKRRAIGHAVRFAAESIRQIVGPADGLLVDRGESFASPCLRVSLSPLLRVSPSLLPPLLTHALPKQVASRAGLGQLGLRRHFAFQPQTLQFTFDVGRVAAGLFQLSVQTRDRRLGFEKTAIETSDGFRRGQGQLLQDFQRSAPASQLLQIDRRLLPEYGDLGPQGSHLLREVAMAAGPADGLGQGRRIGRRR